MSTASKTDLQSTWKCEIFERVNCPFTPGVLAAWLILIWSTNALQSHAQEANGIPAPPDSFRRLVDDGNVTYKFYSVRPRGQEYDGLTQFKIKVRYQVRLRQTRQRTPFGIRTLATVSFVSLNVQINNEISLPLSYRGQDFWEAQLVRHEFEHVRLNSDERVRLLVRHLISQVKTVTLEPGEAVSSAAMMAKVQAEVDAVIDSVTKLVQANNDLLDQVTQHGQVLMESDPNFFNRLYNEGNLDEQDFEMRGQVRSLLKSSRYRKLSRLDGSE